MREGNAPAAAGEVAQLPNRKGLIIYSLGAVLAVLGIQFLTTLWAAREAREGEHTSVAAAILTSL